MQSIRLTSAFVSIFWCTFIYAAESDDRIVEEIVVVGTHVKGASVTETLPVTVITEDDLLAIGTIDGDELFRSLPSQGAVDFREDNTSTVNSARGDVSSINLRSLGPGNTLVLLNGRRMVKHPGTQSKNLVPAVTINTNSIPMAGVRRLEVLHDGASALYGSDAVAGVVNTVLQDDYEGFKVSYRFGTADTGGLEESQLSMFGGWDFNDGASNISVFATFSDRDGLFANERPYSANADQRAFVAGTVFDGDTSFDNRSTRTPWGQFDLNTTSGTRVSQNGTTLTTSSGRFHIQPDSFTGCRATTATDLATPGICIDDSSLDRDLRYNPGAVRQLISDRERINVFAFLNHEFGNGLQLYGEAGYYTATTNSDVLENTSISSGEIVVPANNYWNPFGPDFFSDGSANPNRLPGLSNVPAEGLPVEVNGARYRLVDVGQREVEVENESYRILAGLRGEFGNWSWDSAILYSEASTDDITDNRVSSSLFQAALNNETPSAYNLFNGGDPNNVTSGDATRNPQSAIDPFLISVQRYSETELGLFDFKISTPSIFEIPGGGVGLAVGVEARHEAYVEDRDPRLDGTITYTNFVTGEVVGSDVMGTSPTSDSDGDRDVVSVYGELLIPIVGEQQNIPGIHSFNVQLAARIEDYSDVGGSGFKPRIATDYALTDWLHFRGSYSEGFRAPNLPQINEIAVARSNTREDSIFCEAGVRNGTFATFSDCSGFTESREERRSGNPDLEPEDDENTTFGVVIQINVEDGPLDFLSSLVFTADWWKIEQEKVVGIFGGGNHIDLDYALRVQGGSNPDVVRAAPDAGDIAFFAGTGLDPAGEILFITDQYLNLLPRTIKGWDFGAYWSWDNSPIGTIDVKLNAARMYEFFVDPSDKDSTINSAVDAGIVDSSISVSNSGSILLRNGQPEWRGNAIVTVRHPSGFGGGIRISHITEYEDTSTGLSSTGTRYFVDDWTTYSAYLQYTIEDAGFLGGTNIRVGVNNITDEEPPYLDTTSGYDSANHSARERYYYLTLSKSFNG